MMICYVKAFVFKAYSDIFVLLGRTKDNHFAYLAQPEGRLLKIAFHSELITSFTDASVSLTQKDTLSVFIHSLCVICKTFKFLKYFS